MNSIAWYVQDRVSLESQRLPKQSAKSAESLAIGATIEKKKIVSPIG